ncbi:unnamed protein product [Fraxinus pennsylvanica]|uniref:Uncharacterized protein n=1 Tax=Fraxinus pennsylvanica TaxID=56036 RepID=A0AAD2E839_9LAMI|nr:unnamed protein product [Fraxinus pennsylvanica]
MGGCLSKKSTSASSPNALLKPPEEVKSDTQVEKKKAEEETVKKEIFIIKHRKSHEIERRFEDEENKAKNGELVNSYGIMGAAPVRTSSCTKEELDAILIQCGRLSRSSSTGKAAISGSVGSSENGISNLQNGRKCIGSKRSFDFDNENGREGQSTDDKNVVNGDDSGMVGERESRHRRRPSQAAEAGSSSQGGRRRRTPSRERNQAEQKPRSGSRERDGSGSGGRRVSRSPGRRSESPITSSSCVNSSSANANGDRGSRPGKMVSVPATVSPLAMDKSNNAGGGEPNSTTAVKRIQVKRNVGVDGAAGSRASASPRTQSPARANARVCNENQNINSGQNQQQLVSLSRSNSRKAEHSPYRRNPLGEIDTNVIAEHMPSSPGIKTKNNILSQAPVQKPNADNNRRAKYKPDNSLTNVNCKAKERPQLMAEETTGAYGLASSVALNVVTSGTEQLKPLAKTRSRSSRLSRDLDIKLEELSNPTPSYTALLLEDIHNFHQTNNTPPTFSLPPCLTKACSILEAVADLNSTTSSNLSSTFSDERRRNPVSENFTKRDGKDPIVKSKVALYDDLMEPSFQKYVTVRDTVGGESEQQESSGSNSFISSERHQDSSSWEPNSADSTDGWNSSRSNSRQTDRSPLGFQRHALSETTQDVDFTGKNLSTKMDFDCPMKLEGKVT